MEERKPLPAEAKSPQSTLGIELQEYNASQEKTDAIKEGETKQVEREENEKTAVTKKVESKEGEDNGDGKNGEEGTQRKRKKSTNKIEHRYRQWRRIHREKRH